MSVAETDNRGCPWHKPTSAMQAYYSQYSCTHISEILISPSRGPSPMEVNQKPTMTVICYPASSPGIKVCIVIQNNIHNAFINPSVPFYWGTTESQIIGRGCVPSHALERWSSDLGSACLEDSFRVRKTGNDLTFKMFGPAKTSALYKLDVWDSTSSTHTTIPSSTHSSKGGMIGSPSSSTAGLKSKAHSIVAIVIKRLWLAKL